MFVQTQKHLTLTAAAMLFATLVGCGQNGFDSHFATSEHTKTLINEAQTGVGGLPGVTELVDSRFGTPQQLKAWTRLPIDFGGAVGRVSSSSDAAGGINELTLEFEGGAELSFNVDQPLEVQFITGVAAPLTATVAQWTPESGIATLAAALETAPAEADPASASADELSSKLASPLKSDGKNVTSGTTDAPPPYSPHPEANAISDPTSSSREEPK